MSSKPSVYVGTYFKVAGEAEPELKVKHQVHGCEKCDLELSSKFCSKCGGKNKNITTLKTEMLYVSDIIGEEDVFLVPDFPNNVILSNSSSMFLDEEQSINLLEVDFQNKINEFFEEHAESFKKLKKAYQGKIEVAFGVVYFYL